MDYSHNPGAHEDFSGLLGISGFRRVLSYSPEDSEDGEPGRFEYLQSA